MRNYKDTVLGSAQGAVMVMAENTSHALFAGVACPGDDNHTHFYEIVMVRKDEIIVQASAMDELPGEMPDTSNEFGECLARVPNDEVTTIYTFNDYLVHEQCTAADDAMLANAL